MKLLIVFVVGAFFGSVCGDNECFRSIFSDCKRNDTSGMPRLCHDMKPQYDCFARKAVECKMRLAYDVNRGAQMIAGICTEGSVLNRLFRSEKKCFQDAVKDKKCSDPIVAVLSGASNLRELVLKNKESCKLLDLYSVCIAERVDHYCGSHSKALFPYLYSRLSGIGRAICNELILPADENDGRSDNLGQLEPFNIITSFFMYP